MKTFNFKTVYALVYISLVCVKSQNFCESYKKNNQSLIVYSQTNDTIVLIVDKHFWKLREENSGLVFESQDFQASNSSKQWREDEYSFAHPVYDESEPRAVVFFHPIKYIPSVRIEVLNK
jgi:hypothetical protein